MKGPRDGSLREPTWIAERVTAMTGQCNGLLREPNWIAERSTTLTGRAPDEIESHYSRIQAL